MIPDLDKAIFRLPRFAFQSYCEKFTEKGG